MNSNYTAGPDSGLSRHPVHRVTQYQTAGVNARLRVLALRQGARRAHGSRRTTW
ncbi:hypothetical protein ACFV0Z_18420 [Streptomyces xiamenensis]|uniref:hypothetical protein n=1 Tax=Streptomyces xiamenensis TaxID=408015 RepID=UPI0036A76A7F